MLKLSTKRTYDVAFSGENNLLTSHQTPLKKPKPLVCSSLSCSPRNQVKESYFPPSNWNIEDVHPRKWLEWLPAPHRRRLLHYYYQKQKKLMNSSSNNDENMDKTNFQTEVDPTTPSFSPSSSTGSFPQNKEITDLNKKIDDIHLHNNSPPSSYSTLDDTSPNSNNTNNSNLHSLTDSTLRLESNEKNSLLSPSLFESLPKPDKFFAKNERIFTIEDVKEIIQRAVSERESELRDEYDRILSERLQEQHYQFTLWSRDFFDKNCKNKDKYLSTLFSFSACFIKKNYSLYLSVYVCVCMNV